MHRTSLFGERRGVPIEAPEWVREAVTPWLEKGRRGWEPGHFERVAEVYRRAWQEGSPPTMAVADHFNVNKSTAAKWGARCRELGFLGPTRRGKAGGAEAPPKVRRRK